MIDVACAIIINEGKILATRRGQNMSLPFKWEFPGGKIEKFETEEECLRRELKEELNIEIRVNRKMSPKVFHYESFTINLIPLIAEYVSGDIVLLEHNKYLWLFPDQLKGLDWAPADILVLNDFLEI